MIIRVLAPALSHLRPALRLAGPTRPVGSLQGCRAACAAARSRRAAPHPSAAPARLGRPRSPRRADPALAGKAADAPARHPWHRPALAPPPGHPMPLLELLKQYWMQGDSPGRSAAGGPEQLALFTVGILRVLPFQQPVGDARTPGTAVQLALYP